jgi:hypothetical protein|tara:strand:+ start:510 stop:1451 length:942 start_codon:yes stop_codon:yes gene_type:complete
MSKIEVDQIDPSSGTDLTIGSSGDTIKTGGNLDTNDKNIITSSNRDLNLYPNGTGAVEIGGNTNPGTIILNCESNSHGIKLQSPAHSAGQSYTLKFPTGNVTADRFLKVDSVSGSGATGVGQLSFAEAGGGGMDLVSAVSITGDINAISTDAFSSSYNNYKVYVYGLKINGSTNNLAKFRVRTSSGDYTSSNYIVAANGQYGNSGGTSFHNAGQWNADSLDLNGWHLPDDSNWSNAGTRDFIFHFYNTNSTTRYKNIWFDYGGPDETSNKMHTAHGRGHVETTSALTGFKLYSSAGTAFENEGKMLIYGLKES